MRDVTRRCTESINNTECSCVDSWFYVCNQCHHASVILSIPCVSFPHMFALWTHHGWFPYVLACWTRAALFIKLLIRLFYLAPQQLTVNGLIMSRQRGNRGGRRLIIILDYLNCLHEDGGQERNNQQLWKWRVSDVSHGRLPKVLAVVFLYCIAFPYWQKDIISKQK